MLTAEVHSSRMAKLRGNSSHNSQSMSKTSKASKMADRARQQRMVFPHAHCSRRPDAQLVVEDAGHADALLLAARQHVAPVARRVPAAGLALNLNDVIMQHERITEPQSFSRTALALSEMQRGKQKSSSQSEDHEAHHVSQIDDVGELEQVVVADVIAAHVLGRVRVDELDSTATGRARPDE
jgi:hypothetical protein